MREPDAAQAGRGPSDDPGDATRRTHLANERTQLAWWRTGLTSVAVGVGIGRVVPELGGGDRWAYAAVGLGYILYGAAFVLAGTWRQRQVEVAVLDARWRAQDRRVVAALTVAGIVLALATGVLVVIDA